MRVGVPKEIKTLEFRVGLVPGSVRELIHHGHEVVIEAGAGEGSGFSDSDYQAVGTTVVATADDVFTQADMIVKVKEPQPEEIGRLRPEHVLFTYLHLAADRDQTTGLMDSGATAIAYETVTNRRGGLPLLAPMSEVAGRMAIQVGAHCLEKESGGSGVLMGGVPGVPGAKVVIIGGGVSGTNAARMAMGMDAQVTILDRDVERLAVLDFQFGGQLNTVFSTVDAVDTFVPDADVVIGAVLVPGAAAPKLVTRAQVAAMRPGSVLVDIAIDQGGCFETSRPTTHADPTYVEEGAVHYCVTNMPGAVPRTSALALNNATIPYIVEVANNGAQAALRQNQHLLAGLNVHAGKITYEAVARDLELPYTPAAEALVA
jgi:alanine dehydrogenase